MGKLVHYVYLVTNKLTNQQYVGDRSTSKLPEKDIFYLGSGREIKKAIKKYTKKNFSKIVLEICETRIEAGNRQGYYIKLYKTHISQGGYNVSWDGGTCCGDRTHSEETKIIMREKAKLRKPQSEETKKKRNESLKGHKNNLGKKRTPEQNKKRSEARKGYITPEETKLKISTSLKGHSVSKETREKQSKAGKGKIPWNKGLKKT